MVSFFLKLNGFMITPNNVVPRSSGEQHAEKQKRFLLDRRAVADQGLDAFVPVRAEDLPAARLHALRRGRGMDHPLGSFASCVEIRPSQCALRSFPEPARAL
jgi:hypothetical protein